MAQDSRAAGIRVLVVEDQALIAFEIIGALEDAGYQVIGPAISVDQAVQAAERETPDLALVDIDLGPGGSGVDAARQLHDRLGVASIFVTGNPHLATPARDFALGVIAKPHTPDLILDGVEWFCASRRGAWDAAPPRGMQVF